MERKNFTFSELENWLNQRRVTEIECLVPDLTGVARGKILPREKFTEDRGMRLPEAVVAMGVTGEFPEEGPYYDVISPTDQDMHLQADPAFNLPGDTSETRNYFAEDIIDPPVVLDTDGYISIPKGPGLGIRVDAERLARYTIHWQQLRP